MTSHSTSHVRAIMYALIGYSLWATADTFMKLAGELGVPKYQIMSIGSLGGIAMIFLFTAARGKLIKLKPHNYRGLIFLGLLFTLNYFLFLVALSHMPLVNFYTIVFLAPIIVAIMAATFLKEHLSSPMILATVIGFVGVVIAINPQKLFDDRSHWISYCAAFASMLTFATQMLTLRILGQKESRECMAFYPRVFPFLVGSIFIPILGFHPMSVQEYIYCLATGIFGGIGWMLMAQAYKSAPASTIAPFHYSEILTGALLGFIVWNDVPSLNLIIGAVIIVASGLYIVKHASKSSQMVKALKENP